jgi:hypothetical protein
MLTIRDLEPLSYLAPKIKIYVCNPEGIICTSGDTESYHDGEEYGDDDFTSN